MSLPGAGALLEAVEATVPLDDSAFPPPIVVVSPRIRPFLRRLVRGARPRHHVYSRAELPPGAEVCALGVIDWRPA
jgi:flagellar biosynthesis component FlhA